MAGSIGGVTVGNNWIRNNPDLIYPDNHELMSDSELLEALKMFMHPNDMNDIMFELRARDLAKKAIEKATT